MTTSAEKLTTRQLFFFLALITPVGKLLVMPARLVAYAGHDLLLAALPAAVFQSGCVFLALLAGRANKTFFRLLQDTFGAAVAGIFFGALACFFAFCAILPLYEQKLFVQSTFYDTLPSTLSFAPFFLLSSFLCFYPIAKQGRMWDLLAPLFLVGYLGIAVFAWGEADFAALLPVGSSGASAVFKGAVFTQAWYFDAPLVLMLAGKYEYRKGLALKGTLCYAAGMLLVLLFLALFYGVFSEIALRQYFALAKISKYFSGITVLGRIDYLFIFMAALVLIFYGVMPLQACTECLGALFRDSKPARIVLTLCVNTAIFALSLFADYTYRASQDLIAGTLRWVFPPLCLSLPVLAVLLGRKHEKSLS